MPTVDNPGTSQYCANCERLAKQLSKGEGLLRKLLLDGELDIISHMSQNCGSDYYFCSLCGEVALEVQNIQHKKGCLYTEIKLFIEESKVALEPKP